MRIFSLVVFFGWFVFGSTARAAQLRVGPGLRYETPGAAARAVRDGDRVFIAAGVYSDCAVWRANDLIIRGPAHQPGSGEEMAHMRGAVCGGKAIWIVQGNNTIVENIEFSGMKAPHRNGAGIRHEGRGLTIRNGYFHDGESGILGGGQKPGDRVRIERSLFQRLGRDGQVHPIYIGRAAQFFLLNSTIRDCLDQAKCVKSRARAHLLSCNLIAGGAGPSSWEIDLPEGGLAYVQNNVIQQGPNSLNGNLIGFAMETNAKRRHPRQTLHLHDNRLINDRHAGTPLKLRRYTNTELNIGNNRLIGFRGVDETLFPRRNNRLLPSRHHAGLPDFPHLPAPCR